MASPQRGQPARRQYAPTGDPLLDSIVARSEFQPGATDLRDELGNIHYLVADKNVEAILKRDPMTEALLVGTSNLVRTSKMSKRDRRIAKRQWTISCVTSLLALKKPRLVDLALYNNLLIYGHTAIDDTGNGWRGLLQTNKMRTIRVERGARRGRGVLGFLGVR